MYPAPQMKHVFKTRPDSEFIKCIEAPLKQNSNQFHAAKNIKRVSINLDCKTGFCSK